MFVPADDCRATRQDAASDLAERVRRLGDEVLGHDLETNFELGRTNPRALSALAEADLL